MWRYLSHRRIFSRLVPIFTTCFVGLHLWGCTGELAKAEEDDQSEDQCVSDVDCLDDANHMGDVGADRDGDASQTHDADDDTDSEQSEELATVTTRPVTSITIDSAHSGGEVLDEGSSHVTTRGICWSKSQAPTTDDDLCRLVGQGPGEFSAEISDLSADTDYLVRAFAINATGTSYGDEQSFTTATEQQITVPTVITTSVTAIATNSAQGAGEVTASGNAEISDRGLCWATHDQPTTADTCATAGSGVGEFSIEMAPLEPDAAYFARAYATNSEGTAYGESVGFHTEVGVVSCGTVTDIEGTTYEAVQIGSQCWMAENLRTSTYRDGSTIENITDDLAWGPSSSGAWAYYNNDASNAEPYGMIYNWYAVSDPRGLCPDGWTVPSDEDWKTLELALGMSQSEVDATGHRGGDDNTNPGGSLKSTGTEHWLEPNEGATNTTGFSAYPGGDRNPGPDEPGFWSMSYSAYFWTATELGNDHAWMRGLSYAQTSIDRATPAKNWGFSVRCVQ